MFKIYVQKTVILLLLLFFTPQLIAQPVLSLTPVINGLSLPIQLVNAGDGSNRVFVVHKEGTIIVFDQSNNSLGTFLTVSDLGTDGERGLLSMTFPPGYNDPTNDLFGYFFVYYTNSNGDLVLARYRVSSDANVANASSKVIVLTIPHPINTNHNGGTLHFGSDGYLYFGTGDGGAFDDPPNNAQNGNVLLGKMLRIALNNSATSPFYTIPADNPFVSAVDTLHEIWSFGLRNPFRWSFDKLTHDMWIGDVGQDAWEEIDYRKAGSTGGINYGWRCYEGNASYIISGCNASYTAPVYVYPNPADPGRSAVTGGTVYRGTTVASNATLRGYYLAADFYSGDIYKISPDGSGGWTTSIQAGVQTGIVNFGEAENGELYAISLTAGTVSGISVSGILPLVLAEFTAHPNNGVVELKWKTSSEQNLRQFEIEYSADRNSFIRAGIVPAANALAGAVYAFSHIPPTNRIFYRLKMTDIDGQFKYSDILMVQINKTNNHFVQPSFITTGAINVFLNTTFNTLELISMNGTILMKQNINGRTGRMEIPIPSVIPGTYIIRLRNNETTLQQKILVR
jgi:glucose/arabinose dehydrogenase